MDSPERTLSASLQNGTLLSPLGGPASTMGLFRALATVCGAGEFSKARGQAELTTLLAERDHLVFALVDGLGLNLRPTWPPGGFFETAFHSELRAIFPSTTASVLSSLATCVWPAQHGIPGWYTHLPQRGFSILPLPFIERREGRELRKMGIGPGDVIGAPSVMGRYDRPSRTHLPVRFVQSDYSVWARSSQSGLGYRSPDQVVAKVRRFVRHRRRTYTYLYFSEVDHLSHRHGWRSPQVADAVHAIDRTLMRLADALPDNCRLVVTADHGQVVVPESRRYQLTSDDGGGLMNLLRVPPTGEPRTPVFHVRDGLKNEFRDRFRGLLGESYVLLQAAEIEDLELYGPEGLSEVMRSRLGDFVAIAREPASLEYVPPGGESLGFSGFHGGLLPDEMRVPLFMQ